MLRYKPAQDTRPSLGMRVCLYPCQRMEGRLADFQGAEN